MTNSQIASILNNIALLSQIQGANKFRIRAYENAATAIENLSGSLTEISDLTSIKGIGKGIATEIEELLASGKSDRLEELKEELGGSILDLTKINGLGPKRIKLLFDELDVRSLSDLKKALESGAVEKLSGFGPKLRANLAKELERLDKLSGLTPLPVAVEIAERFIDRFRLRDDVLQIEYAGSLRRGKELIGDIDLLIGTKSDPNPIFDTFVAFPEVADTLVKGETKTSVLLHNGIQVDLRIVDNDQFGAALHYFTGSKAHNVAIRMRAKKLNLKVNEYGVFEEGSDTPLASKGESDIFSALSLAYIPPELREDQGEIEQAASQCTFDLVSQVMVLGDLHMHTVESDGVNTITEMAEAARYQGWNYIAITDHSQSLTVANGLTPQRLSQHIENIREANKQFDDITILCGLEVDILKDGTLDMDHDLLRECDWVVGSIHSIFTLSSAQMTDRLITAISTGLLSTLGHPTGRILGGRDGYQYDLEEVVAAANAHRCAFEINGSYGRLDLNGSLARRVSELGGIFSFGSDAHSSDGFSGIRFAVQQARRAGLHPNQVVNTFPVEKLLTSVRML